MSQALARRLGATYLRIDAIEQAIKAGGASEVGATGYTVANALAEANLRLGHTVIADCVNPVPESRRGWRETAARSSAQLIEVEIVCSDLAEHRKRVEGRLADIPGHLLPELGASESISTRMHMPTPPTDAGKIISRPAARRAQLGHIG